MNSDLITRAADLLSEARNLLDRAKAPPEFAAKLQEVIDLIDESDARTGEGFSRPAA